MVFWLLVSCGGAFLRCKNECFFNRRFGVDFSILTSESKKIVFFNFLCLFVPLRDDHQNELRLDRDVSVGDFSLTQLNS